MNPFRNAHRALWISIALTLASECLWVAVRRCRPRVDPAEQVRLLVSRLDAKGLHLHAVPASSSGDPRMGVYLCAGPARREALEPLMHIPDTIATWQGVVFVGRDYPVYEEERLGSSTAVIGRCRLFGDPGMVAAILKALEAE